MDRPAKIAYFELSIHSQQQVFRLNVSVDHALRVAVDQCSSQREDISAGHVCISCPPPLTSNGNGSQAVLSSILLCCCSLVKAAFCHQLLVELSLCRKLQDQVCALLQIHNSSNSFCLRLWQVGQVPMGMAAPHHKSTHTVARCWDGADAIESQPPFAAAAPPWILAADS